MLVNWTERALKDLAAIKEYIAEDSPTNAYRFIESIFDTAAGLNQLPDRGRQVPEAKREDIRELIFKDYRIIYLVKQNKIDILTVIHSSRDLIRLPKKPWSEKQ